MTKKLLRDSNMKKFGALRSYPRALKSFAGLLALVASPLLISACSSSTTASQGTTIASIPSGWKTYTYGKVAISAPGNWAVKQDNNCPDSSAPGTLHLGLPAVDLSCPTPSPSIGSVVVWQLSAETGSSVDPTGQKSMTINGIPVKVGFGSPTLNVWTVPSLRVQITGTGPKSLQVMHTLRRA